VIYTAWYHRVAYTSHCPFVFETLHWIFKLYLFAWLLFLSRLFVAIPQIPNPLSWQLGLRYTFACGMCLCAKSSTTFCCICYWFLNKFLRRNFFKNYLALFYPPHMFPFPRICRIVDLTLRWYLLFSSILLFVCVVFFFMEFLSLSFHCETYVFLFS